jgi:uncharacterized membrane protein
MDVFRATRGRTAGRSDRVRDLLRQAFVSGLAVVVPMLVTIIVLAVAGRAVYDYLNLFARYLPPLPRIEVLPGVVLVPSDLLVELSIPVLLLGIILVVGLVVNSSRYGERAVDWFDYVIASIPGVGSVYDSFRQMSDVMLESDTQNFREVKLVEFPHEDAYTLGFVTTETPEPLRVPTGHEEMLTLFLPLAPNPVMGGHLVHVPAEKVMDVDLSVEEGLRAVVTSGVAVPDGTADDTGLSGEQLRELGADERADRLFEADRRSPETDRRGHTPADWRRRYEADLSPEREPTPADLADPDYDPTDQTPGDLETTAERSPVDPTTPADVERDTSREPTDVTPSELEDRRTDSGTAGGEHSRSADSDPADPESDHPETDDGDR